MAPSRVVPAVKFWRIRSSTPSVAETFLSKLKRRLCWGRGRNSPEAGGGGGWGGGTGEAWLAAPGEPPFDVDARQLAGSSPKLYSTKRSREGPSPSGGAGQGVAVPYSTESTRT